MAASTMHRHGTLRTPCLLAATLLALAASATASATGDSDAGKQAFLLCGACHSAAPGAAALIGPNLWNVVGRPVAAADAFDYSDALEAVGGTWTIERIGQFIANPNAFAPGTRMGFAGVLDPTERADILAYVATLADGSADAPTAPPIDYGPDWPAGPGQAEAGQLCNSCHSLTLVKQQKLSRKTWDKLLVWMVEEQGMAEQPAATRERILDYLAEHFGAPE